MAEAEVDAEAETVREADGECEMAGEAEDEAVPLCEPEADRDELRVALEDKVSEEEGETVLVGEGDDVSVLLGVPDSELLTESDALPLRLAAGEIVPEGEPEGVPLMVDVVVLLRLADGVGAVESEAVALVEGVRAAEGEAEAEALGALQPAEAERMTVPAGQREQVLVAPGSEYV